MLHTAIYTEKEMTPVSLSTQSTTKTLTQKSVQGMLNHAGRVKHLLKLT